MSTVEVDELELKQNRQLRDQVNLIMSNPKSRRLLEQATKVVDPNAKTPLIDHEEEINAPLKAVEKRLAEFEAAQAKDKEERERNDKLSALGRSIDEGFARLRQGGYTDEGLTAIRKIMDEKGITDVDVAQAYFDRMNPPATPVSPRGSGAWNFMEEIGEGEKDLQELIKTKGEHNPLIDKMANQTLAEMRGQSSRR